MDDKDFQASCDFLKENFTGNETEELENIPEEFELKYLRRNLMCKLLLSFSQVPFCPVSILSVDYYYKMKLLLTN